MKYITLIIAIGCLSFGLQAQSNVKIAGQSLSELQTVPILHINVPSIPSSYQNMAEPVTAPSLSAVFKNYPKQISATMPKAWAYEDLAFFCKIEVQMEKTTKLPIKFRVGEVQQVEKMEGKLKSY